jgi:hypothetical protein
MTTKRLETFNTNKRGGRFPQTRGFVNLMLACLALLLTPASLFADSTYSVTVDTSLISGTPALLAFDCIDGGPPSNTITISNFLTDGTLGSSSPTGGVSGTLPGTVTLTDLSFFNEYLTNITLGASFSFLLDATTNGPAPSSLSDALSVFLLDPNTGLPLLTTSDPTLSDSLFTLNIDGTPQGSLAVYTAIVDATPGTVSSVPEPPASTLLAFGLAFLIWRFGRGRYERMLW